MPSRIISEKCRTSRSLDALSDRAERLFWRLMTVADDQGRFEADHRLLLATCFPLKVGIWTPEEMAQARTELAQGSPQDAIPIIQLYEWRSRVLGQFCAFLRHQRRRDSKPKLPAPTDPECILLSAAGCRESPQIAALNEIRESGDESRETRSERRPVVLPVRTGRVGEECPEEVREKLQKIRRGTSV